uniref:Uncharacterized protein n=1 Tax=Cannabis sativa TaxID=3483 RepID=A0A803PYQ4_CANSA
MPWSTCRVIHGVLPGQSWSSIGLQGSMAGHGPYRSILVGHGPTRSILAGHGPAKTWQDKNVVGEYFTNLLTANEIRQDILDDVLKAILKSATTAMNDNLSKVFYEEEMFDLGKSLSYKVTVGVLDFKIYDRPILPDHIYVADLKLADGTWDMDFTNVVLNGDDAEKKEDVYHVLWGCRRSVDIWKKYGLWSQIFQFKTKDLILFLRNLLQVWNPKTFAPFLMAYWHIWDIRNSINHGGCVARVRDVVEWCRKFLSEFQEANRKPIDKGRREEAK